MFQSTHPHGVRQISRFEESTGNLFQSTHPHGVRPLLYVENIGNYEFQSTHPHGVRLYRYHPLYSSCEFQSTHPHGVRLFTEDKCIGKLRFNPRTRTGCDKHKAVSTEPLLVSIHAPARGATLHMWLLYV